MLIENILEDDKDRVTKISQILSDRYKGRGPFYSELCIVLRYCLRDPSIHQIRENLKKYAEVLRLVVIDNAIWVIEEVFRKVYWNVNVGSSGLFEA